ncbi:MAG: hypothetical protein U0892_09410 [Pirellulales bacterium]
MNVSAAYSIISGAAMNTAVGFVSAEEVGMTKKIVVGSKLEITVGASKFDDGCRREDPLWKERSFILPLQAT